MLAEYEPVASHGDLVYTSFRSRRGDPVGRNRAKKSDVLFAIQGQTSQGTPLIIRGAGQNGGADLAKRIAPGFTYREFEEMGKIRKFADI